MDLSNLQPKTLRKKQKRVGRGGKRGTFSGGGTKGQKSRAGSSVKPGFRGGDNRIWQLFPKKRGASKKHGNSRPHRKHRFYQFRNDKLAVVNLSDLNSFKDGDLVTPETLLDNQLIENASKDVKILGDGDLKRRLIFKDVTVSKSVAEKIAKSGGAIQSRTKSP